jgi:hypothetical protein
MVGRKEEFLHKNKLFSKFAHPTALAVMDYVPLDAIRHFKEELYNGGRFYGELALEKIDSFK